MMRPAPVALRVQGGGGLSPVGEPAHVPGRTVQMSQTRIALHRDAILRNL